MSKKKGLYQIKCDSKKISFEVVSYEWIRTQRVQLKKSSIAKYENILSSYLIPEFGERLIKEISRNEIVAFSRFLLTKRKKGNSGLAPKTVNCIISLLKSILIYGAQEYDVSIADLRNVSVRQPNKPMRILSNAEQKRLSKYLLEQLKPCNLGIFICLYTGLRIGEICALKWKDICFDEGCIFVNKSMQRIQVHDKNKKTAIFILPPKSTCSIRKIPIPAELIKILKQTQKEENAFLLSGKEDKYIEPRCLENKFNTIVSACNIDSITFHSIRHTFATKCVELGFDIKSLSEILGHSIMLEVVQHTTIV